MTLAIYGGSFNPVHLGHVGIARRAIGDLSPDLLIVIPANVSPFKQPHPMPWDRLASVRAAFADMPGVEVDDREIRRGGVSYAIDTVREIRAERKLGAEDRLYFIIGEDSVEGLPRWKDYDELVKLVKFVSYPRTPESSTAIRTLFEDAGVVANPDAKMFETVRNGLYRKGNYCPCRLQKTPENFCPCAEFRGQLADPAFHGPCHCRLYLKP